MTSNNSPHFLTSQGRNPLPYFLITTWPYFQCNFSSRFYCRSCFIPLIYNIQPMHSSKKIIPVLQQKHPQGLLSVKSMTNIRCTSKVIQTPTPRAKAFEKYQVIIQTQKFQTQIKLIEWRSKTEFPIVKIIFYKILHKKVLNQCPVVQIAIEHFNTSLFSLPKMPLFQVFYLLKQSIIGFERLYDRFGGFDINSKMVLINKNLKCRVWINQNITLNFPSKKIKVTQTQFKNQIIKMYEDKCIKSTLSCQFFKSAQGIKNMVEVIHFVEAFARSNRIILANKFNNIYGSLGSMADENAQHRFQTSSMKKIPKFIQELREMRRLEKNVDSKSFDSPVFKKEVILNRELSHHRLRKKQSEKSDIESTSKSFLTPKSLASNEVKQEHRSNNQEAADPPKKITKKQSHQNFYNMSVLSNYEPIEPFKTEKVMPRQEPNKEEKKINEKQHQFQLTKIHKFRKLSNGEDLQHRREQKEKLMFQPKEHLTQDNKFNISLLSPIGRRKGEVSLKNILQNTPKIGQIHQPNQDVFFKNGWLKRFNSLTVDQFRDTIHSHFDGTDILSDELRLCNLDLGLLGAMGKQLRGSIFLQKQR